MNEKVPSRGEERSKLPARGVAKVSKIHKCGRLGWEYVERDWIAVDQLPARRTRPFNNLSFFEFYQFIFDLLNDQTNECSFIHFTNKLKLKLNLIYSNSKSNGMICGPKEMISFCWKYRLILMDGHPPPPWPWREIWMFPFQKTHRMIFFFQEMRKSIFSFLGLTRRVGKCRIILIDATVSSGESCGEIEVKLKFFFFLGGGGWIIEIDWRATCGWM